MLITLLQFLFLTQVFRDLDRIIATRGYVKQYYLIHVLHNLAIVGLTAPDVIAAFSLQTGSINWPSVTLCYALHAYHIIDYYKTMRHDDWLHHGLMIGVALPLGSMIPCGSLLGCNLFFTTGLPGAISYGLLFAERNKLIETEVLKRWNARTNLWIRTPGCVAQATLTLVSALTTEATRGQRVQRVAGILIAVLTAWNGLYFMEQAVKARYVNTLVIRR